MHYSTPIRLLAYAEILVIAYWVGWNRDTLPFSVGLLAPSPGPPAEFTKGAELLDQSIPPSAESVFATPADGRYSFAEFIDIDRDGGRVIIRYSGVSDSGVAVERLGRDGGTMWRSYVRRLGAAHSAYRHDATVRLDDGELVIASYGLGTVQEHLDLATGERLSRQVK